MFHRCVKALAPLLKIPIHLLMFHTCVNALAPLLKIPIYLLVFPDRCELPRPHYHSHFVPKFISNIDDACVDIVQPYIGVRIEHVRTYRSTSGLNVRELSLRVLRKF